MPDKHEISHCLCHLAIATHFWWMYENMQGITLTLEYVGTRYPVCFHKIILTREGIFKRQVKISHNKTPKWQQGKI